jgi:hypothetical protein
VPEPTDRDAWLARVAASLDLPDSMAADVLEELAGHLDDASAAWRDAGIDPVDADRRAVRGLGDPGALGRDLGRARRRGRFLLAAVGGAVRGTVVFGIWAWLVLWLVTALIGVLGMTIASTILHAAGSSTSSYFGGPGGSLVTVGITLAWFAWLGRILPARVATSTRRSVRGVRVALGAAGLVVGTVALWSFVGTDMDPILAVGLPLGPVAFLVAAVRAPDDPSLRLGSRPAVTLALGALALVIAVVGALATTTPSQDGGWEADLSALGADPGSYPIFAATDYSMGWGGSYLASVGDGRRAALVERASLTIGDEAQAAAFARQFPVLQVELRTASVVDGHLLIGATPLAVASSPMSAQTEVQLDLPVLRTPLDVTTLTVAIAPDGTRVIIGGPDGPFSTPRWHGTLAAWWFGD